jgi:hypothetical protein
MRLTTAHIILIGSAIVFFAGYGLWELARYQSAGIESSLVAGVLALAGAGGLGMYLRRFLQRLQ